MEVTNFEAPPMEAGGLTLVSPGSVFGTEFRALSRVGGEEFHGVLGMDVLRHYVLQVDFDAGVLRLSPSLPPDWMRGKPLDLRFDGGRPQLTAVCGSQETSMVVDTGSSNTCLDHNVFGQLVQHREMAIGARHTVATAAGRRESRSGLLTNLGLAGLTLHDVVCDSETMSLLGLRHLARFIVVFDFPSGKIYLTPGARFEACDPRGVSGLWPVRTACRTSSQAEWASSTGWHRSGGCH